MAHRFKKAARRLQRHWNVPYSTALKACTDLEKEADFSELLHEKKSEGKSFNDALVELALDTFEFEED